LTVSRLAIGGNPFSGISHQNRERDIVMRDYFTVARIKETLAECEKNGISLFFGRADNHIMRMLAEYWNEGGRIRWFAQTTPERSSLHDNIRQAADSGAAGIYIHGGTAKDFRDSGDWGGLAKAVELIRSLGIPAGSATHQPDFHAARRGSGVDLDFCLQCLYQLDGRRGKIHEHDAKETFYDDDRIPALEAVVANPEPTFAYKVLAAGRKETRPALTEVARYLKPADGILMGMCPDTNINMVADNAALVASVLNSRRSG
jgi:hypothetical protein